MSLKLLLFLLVLGLPLVGATLGLLLRRLVHNRVGLFIAALFLFLTGVAVILFVQMPAMGVEDLLAQPLPTPVTPEAQLQIAPTARWVQPARTLAITGTLAPPVTPTPTIGITPSPTPNPVAEATIAVRNGTEVPGLAGRTAEQLEAEGFIVVEIENDRLAGERPNTLILDRGDHPEVRTALAEFLDIDESYIETNSDEPGGEANADIILVLGDDFEE